MSDSISCPHCKKSIPLTEALTHQMSEKMEQQLGDIKKKAEEREKYLINLGKKRVIEEREKAAKEVEVSLRKKITEEMELKLKDTQNESEELRKEKKAMQEQFLELNKTIRELKGHNEKKEIELTKRFNEEQEKLRTEEKKKASEEFKLTLMEKDKKLQDVVKANEDLKRKLEQGSQQMQGEVLELEVEETLKREFPLDSIDPVPKGVTGADVIQTVRNNTGKKAGTILWEMKRTKTWSQKWIEKLKDDQRTVRAEMAVIISAVVPEDLNRFGQVNGVWVCGFDNYLGVAHAMRVQMKELSAMRIVQVGQKGKMDMLYQYITSVEFKHRMEAIIESFTNMQQEIEKEKRWFTLKWSREEKNIRNIIDNTVGMRGDLQSIMGNTLKELEGIEDLAEEHDDDQKDGELF